MASGNNGNELLGLMPGTALVVANNAPASFRQAALQAKSFYGERIQICDGVQDQAELNAAINACSIGGSVRHTEGQYNLGASVTPQDYIELCGEGFGTVYRADNNTNFHLISIDQKTGVGIKNIRIDGNKANQAGMVYTSREGIYINQPVNVIIDSVWVINAAGCGLYLVGTGSNYESMAVNNSIFTYSQFYGVLCGDRGEYVQFTNCKFNYNLDHGFNVFGAGNVNITGCDALGNGGVGIIAWGSVGSNPGRVTVTGCHLNHNTKEGIKLSGMNGSSLTGNHIFQNGYDGILITSCTNTNVVGGRVGASSQAGAGTYNEISITGTVPAPSSQNTIQGVILDSYAATKAAYSISEGANCSNNQILDNIITNAGGTGVYSLQTGTYVRGKIGYVTQNSGTGTINTGAGPWLATITHGCSYTPAAADIVVTLTENPTNTPGAIWVDTITATQFNVNCENDPGVSNLDFSWAVRKI